MSQNVQTEVGNMKGVIVLGKCNRRLHKWYDFFEFYDIVDIIYKNLNDSLFQVGGGNAKNFTNFAYIILAHLNLYPKKGHVKAVTESLSRLWETDRRHLRSLIFSWVSRIPFVPDFRDIKAFPPFAVIAETVIHLVDNPLDVFQATHNDILLKETLRKVNMRDSKENMLRLRRIFKHSLKFQSAFTEKFNCLNNIRSHFTGKPSCSENTPVFPDSSREKSVPTKVDCINNSYLNVLDIKNHNSVVDNSRNVVFDLPQGSVRNEGPSPRSVLGSNQYGTIRNETIDCEQLHSTLNNESPLNQSSSNHVDMSELNWNNAFLRNLKAGNRGMPQTSLSLEESDEQSSEQDNSSSAQNDNEFFRKEGVNLKNQGSTVTISIQPDTSTVNIQISPTGLQQDVQSGKKRQKKNLKPRNKVDVMEIAQAISSSVNDISEVKITGKSTSLSSKICKKINKKNCKKNWLRLCSMWVKNVGNIQGLVKQKLASKQQRVPVLLSERIISYQTPQKTTGVIRNEDKSNNTFVKNDPMLTFYRGNVMQNGLFNCPDYYCNPLSELQFILSVYSRSGLDPIMLDSKDYKILFERRSLSDKAIDACIAASVRSNQVSSVLQLTVFETHVLLSGAYTENYHILHLDLDNYEIIILPHTRSNGYWDVLIVLMKTNEIYSYSTSSLGESESYSQFLKFLNRRNKIGRTNYNLKLWNYKMVKHSTTLQQSDSGVFIIGFIQSLLCGKDSLHLNPIKFRDELKTICLEFSDCVLGNCLYCGKGDLANCEKFRCRACKRFVHFKDTCLKFNNVPIHNGVLIDNFFCELCKVF